MSYPRGATLEGVLMKKPTGDRMTKCIGGPLAGVDVEIGKARHFASKEADETTMYVKKTLNGVEFLIPQSWDSERAVAELVRGYRPR